MPRRPRTARPARSSPWGWAGAGLLFGLLLACVLQAPASWLTRPLQQNLNQRLLLEDPRGTIWNGSARLVLSGGAGSPDAAALPDRLSWRIRPTSTGLAIELSAPCCLQPAWRLLLQPGWGHTRLILADSRSQWPARWLSGLGTPWNTLQPDGLLNLSTQGLALQWTHGRLVMAGHAQLDAVQLSSRLATLRPMGSYRLTVTGAAVPTVRLETLEGRLQLSGAGQWLSSGLRFDGLASAAPEHLDALTNLLNIIGRRDGARAIIKVG